LQLPVLKVAITGPESTGKSTLARQLAHYYQTNWVPEFARSYIAYLPDQYTAQDVENIARGQLQSLQQVAAKTKRLLFADTDLLVIKIWMLHAFGFCPSWILEKLESQNFELYLLMRVDLPWEPDPQREHPHLRQFFYDWYKAELEAYKFNFVEIGGSQEIRLQNAISYVDKLFL